MCVIYINICTRHGVITSTPINTYLFKVNNGNTKAIYEICLKLTLDILKRHQCRHSGVFIDNFEHILCIFLGVSIVDFQQVNADWDMPLEPANNCSESSAKILDGSGECGQL